MRLLIFGWNRELTASMHHVHDLNAGGRNTIEHYVVWVRDDLTQARHAIADAVQVGVL